MSQIDDIFKLAKSKGAENLAILIFDEENENLNDITERDPDSNVVLYINGKDRFGCTDLNQLEESIKEHDNLDWTKEPHG